jgi:copper chaperone
VAVIKLKVSGMTCNHCVMHVTKALQGVSGVLEATVSLERGEAVVEGSPKLGDLIAAVQQQGYEAEEKRT